VSAAACSLGRHLVRRAFAERRPVPRPLAGLLWRHLRGCDACRGGYDRIARLERLAASKGESAERPAALELALWSARVVHRARVPVRARAGVGVLAAATAAAALVLWVQQPQELTPRSGGPAALTVRALCAQHDLAGNRVVRSLADEPGPAELAACPDRGTVLFARTSTRAGWLYVVARPMGRAPRWLSPAAPGDTPIAVVPAAELTPLDGVRLDPGEGPWGDAVDVAFVLADVADARASLAAALDRGVALERLGDAVGGTSLIRRVHFYQAGGR